MQERNAFALVRFTRVFALALLPGMIVNGGAYALDLTLWNRDGICVGIVLNGEIRRNEAAGAIQRIDAAAEKCATRNILIGKMPGGSVNDALAIGMAIRAQGYDTAMVSSSQCYSACGLVYLGGVQRYWHPRARIIIHRPEIHETFRDLAVETTAYEELRTRLIRYVSDMGANPDYVDAMYAIGPRGYEEVGAGNMTAWALFTTSGMPF